MSNLSALLSESRQQLSAHKLNKLSLCEKDSYDHTKQTYCPHADMDEPQKQATVAAEKSLETRKQMLQLGSQTSTE